MSYTSGTGSFASHLPYGQSQAPMDQGTHSTAAWSSSPRPSMPLPPVPQPGKPSLPAYSAPVESASPPPYREPEQPYYEASLQQPQHSQALSQPQPQAQPYSEVTWLQSQPQSQPQQLSLSAQRELQARMKVEKEKMVELLMKLGSWDKSKATEVVERIPVTDPSKMENIREVLKLYGYKTFSCTDFSWSRKTLNKRAYCSYGYWYPFRSVETTKDQRLSMRALMLYIKSEVDRDYYLYEENHPCMCPSSQEGHRSYVGGIWSQIGRLSDGVRELSVCKLQQEAERAQTILEKDPDCLSTKLLYYNYTLKMIPFLIEGVERIKAAADANKAVAPTPGVAANLPSAAVLKQQIAQFLQKHFDKDAKKAAEIAKRIPTEDQWQLNNIYEALRYMRQENSKSYKRLKEQLRWDSYCHHSKESKARTTADQRLTLRALILYTHAHLDRKRYDRPDSDDLAHVELHSLHLCYYDLGINNAWDACANVKSLNLKELRNEMNQTKRFFRLSNAQNKIKVLEHLLIELRKLLT